MVDVFVFVFGLSMEHDCDQQCMRVHENVYCLRLVLYCICEDNEAQHSRFLTVVGNFELEQRHVCIFGYQKFKTKKTRKIAQEELSQ